MSLSRPESAVLLLTTMRLTRLMCLHASDTIVISDYACDHHPVILTDASSTSIRRAIIDDSSSCDFDTTLNPQTHHLVDFDKRNSHAMRLLSSWGVVASTNTPACTTCLLAIYLTRKAFSVNFAPPKRRFWKEEQKMKCGFSKHLSTVRGPNWVLTPLKSASKIRISSFVPPSKIFVWGA